MTRLYEPLAYAKNVGSYWETTATPPLWAKLERAIRVETLIIGGGYTGLNCALELVENGTEADTIAILEAQQPGWGASGRNGGFCCIGGSKLSVQAQIRQFGETATRAYRDAQLASIQTVRNNLANYGIDADVHSNGETLMAHKPGQLAELEREQASARDFFGEHETLINRGELPDAGLASPEFHGALTNPNGFAINPMKYVAGLAEAVGKTAIRTFGYSPALAIERTNNRYRITTPDGSVEATDLVIATNGYSDENLPPWLKGKLLPVLTNILVTRPLSSGELADQGWTSHQMCYDTRNALHYFRLIPPADGEPGPRMLFGMRGGTSATPASMAKMKQRIRTDFNRIFPAWQEVETPFFWSGLACLTRNLTGYTGPIPEMANAWASLAYHGNGVAMGSHCGRLTAGMMLGHLTTEELPPQMRTPLRRFPFAAFRRHYLEAAYKWFEWRDG